MIWLWIALGVPLGLIVFVIVLFADDMAQGKHRRKPYMLGPITPTKPAPKDATESGTGEAEGA